MARATRTSSCAWAARSPSSAAPSVSSTRITLQVVSGYSGTYSYDNRLANTPPPFFPTTGSHYDVISWQRVTSTL